MRQGSRCQWRFRLPQTFGKIGAHPVEFTWIGALERIDRLLFITDHKDGAQNISTRTFTRGEFTRQPLDDVPLDRRCILRLVYKNMVDAAIKTVQHPFCHQFVA